jgi:hypothetical protein
MAKKWWHVTFLIRDDDAMYGASGDYRCVRAASAADALRLAETDRTIVRPVPGAAPDPAWDCLPEGHHNLLAHARKPIGGQR